jgi:arsenite methyltransferase
MPVLCLHNIEPETDRRAACLEIVRVLKPGGTALIADFIKTADYAAVFKGAGLTVIGPKRQDVTAWTGMAVVAASKAPC